jgi:hypothetical protein
MKPLIFSVMKGNILKSVFAAIGITAALSFTTFAGPLRGNDVAESAGWVAHLDCDALRSNALGQFILGEMGKPENKSKIDAVTAIFGVDVRTQIHAVTLYAAADTPHEPVALVYGEFDTNRLVTLAKSAGEYDSMEHGQYMVHSWLDDKKKKPDGTHPRVYAALPTTNMIIFGPRRQAVTDALDVLDKKGDNLTANKKYADLLKSSGDKTFFQAAAPKMILPAAHPDKVVADLTTHVRLSAREDNERIAGVLSIGGRDEEVARNMVSIAQGLVGLGKAQHEKPKLATLAEKVNIKQDGTELTITFAAPSDEVIEFLKMAAAHKKH